MYDRNLTEASKGALLELCMSLESYRHNFILAGGWAPYFLSWDHFDHCGSMDIDFVLRPAIIQRYESIKEIVEGLGYIVTRNPFRFVREIKTTDRKRAFQIHLDILTEPEPALGQDFLVEVQEDLRACLIPGISIVFDHYYEQDLEATLPGGGEAAYTIDVADIVGTLTTKGNALPRLKDKDSYDIYSVAGFHAGSPLEAARAFKRLIGEGSPTISRAMMNIRNSFESPSRYGCVSVARFMGSNGSIRNDAYQRVTTFIDYIGTQEK